MSRLNRTLFACFALALAGTANATVYDATNANADQWHSSFGGTNPHNHALWLPGVLPGRDWLIDRRNPGVFDYNESAGTASFSGSVFNELDSSATASFSFDFTLVPTTSPIPTIPPPISNPKKELIPEAYTPAGGGVDTDTWTYFNFAGNGSFTGTGGVVTGLELTLQQDGQQDPNYFRAQLGDGANGKNINFGFSSWFLWSLLDTSGTGGEDLAKVVCPGYIVERTCAGRGDINIDLSVNPVPIPAAAWLFGTALLGFIGFSRRTSV